MHSSVLVPLLLDRSVPQHGGVATTPIPHKLVTSPCLGLEESTGTRASGCRSQAQALAAAAGLKILN